jgi:hypothetical protein
MVRGCLESRLDKFTLKMLLVKPAEKSGNSCDIREFIVI